MAFETYGLEKDQYRKIFLEKTEFMVDLFLAMKLKAEAKGLNLDHYDNKFVWNLFQEIGYGTEEAARVHQKKNDPDALLERSYDPVGMPSRVELAESLASVNAKVESLTDYVATLVQALQNGLTKLVD
jgi:hypothetical protein